MSELLAIVAQRREHPSGYRLIELQDLGQAEHAIGRETGFGFLSMAIGVAILLLIVLFFARWIIELVREARGNCPPEMPPAPPPTRARDVTLEEPPPPSPAGERVPSRWRDL